MFSFARCRESFRGERARELDCDRVLTMFTGEARGCARQALRE